MNLYSRKQQWKAVLLVVAVVIVGFSLWYSNYIVSKIREEERLKVQIWSEAVQKRLQLINYTEKLFVSQRKDERQKIKVWAQAMQGISSFNDEINDNDYLLLIQEILLQEHSIPVIIVDQNGSPTNIQRNIDEEILADEEKVRKLMEKMADTYRPITLEVGDIKQYAYYDDSKTLIELEKTLDDLINSFISETVMNSASVPVIVTDSTQTQVIQYGTVDSTIINNPVLLSEKLEQMSLQNEPIKIVFESDQVNYIFYEDSIVITQLRYYPYVQIIIIGLFLLIAYLIFSTYRNAEQNQVWVGLAKETAHQLGTPLSSLMAWIQILESRGMDKETINELNKDVARFEVITDRFSKIGSVPELKEVSVKDCIEQSINYLKPRVSSKINFTVNCNEEYDVKAMINPHLFSWVIENLSKNAIDAMDGKGSITINISNEIQNVFIDISDTGKGISSSKHKSIFHPGYTTKKRGWGLGLSLVKRIINNYHSGKIFVKRSEPGKGTTFRIVLKNKH